MDSAVDIQGFARNVQKEDFWSGKIDAVGRMAKDGKVIVIDLATYADPKKSYWDLASHFGKKLHQGFVYKELLDVHLSEYFNKEISVGIMIVAMRQETDEIDARLCLDFKQLRDNGFFKKIDKFTWHINSSSQEKQNKVRFYYQKILCCS